MSASFLSVSDDAGYGTAPQTLLFPTERQLPVRIYYTDMQMQRAVMAVSPETPINRAIREKMRPVEAPFIEGIK
ncbi:hypothetical protein [Bacteroides rodentium]